MGHYYIPRYQGNNIIGLAIPLYFIHGFLVALYKVVNTVWLLLSINY